MTFGKPRYNNNHQWELLRLCTHPDFRIIGGASKLFKHFITIHNPESVISYCDISKFDGSVYTQLGFNLEYVSPPGCIWAKKNKKITQNLLNQYGYDKLFNTNYGKCTSNRDLMLSSGWLPVYDCGQARYIYRRK